MVSAGRSGDVAAAQRGLDPTHTFVCIRLLCERTTHFEIWLLFFNSTRVRRALAPDIGFISYEGTETRAPLRQRSAASLRGEGTRESSLTSSSPGLPHSCFLQALECRVLAREALHHAPTRTGHTVLGVARRVALSWSLRVQAVRQRYLSVAAAGTEFPT